MPQMAPLWWELMFFLTILCFLLTNISIYYYKKNMKKMTKSIKIYQLNWKW